MEWYEYVDLAFWMEALLAWFLVRPFVICEFCASKYIDFLFSNVCVEDMSSLMWDKYSYIEKEKTGVM